MVALFATFFFFISLGLGRLEWSYLERSDWSESWKIAPILFTAFGFHGIVPTLTTYLNRDPKRVRLAIVLGSIIPLITFCVWQTIILGVIPLPALLEALALGESAVYPLRTLTNIPWLSTMGELFAFLAITTSLLGVALGLRDFLTDGLSVPKRGGAHLLLILGIFFVPLVITFIDPCLFLNALNYGGGIGCALLLGLYPIIMCFSGRYLQKRVGERLLVGGKWLLAILLFFLVAQLALMFLKPHLS